ncbi:unnamed protein product [Closterium sp. Naga37s-1]|nr:unnamed protein product [Closterium sp. Naga37s-1]
MPESVSRIHARHGPEIAVADAQPHSRSGIPTNSNQQFDSQSPEVGASGGRHPSSSGGGGAPRSTTGAGSGGVESIAEWKRRSAEAGAHFFPLQRAEDAPSRDELHRWILVPGDVGGGLKGNGESHRVTSGGGYYLPLVEYDSTLVSTANGTMGNTMVNYSTNIYSVQIPIPVYPYYVNLKLGSQKQEFSMALNLAVPDTFVPCDCLHCASMRKGTTYSKPFSTLSSTTLKYIACSDQRCQGGGYFYGCSTEGLPNYLKTVGMLPGDDNLCVYSAYNEGFDYYEADYREGSYMWSVGHVVEDTVYLTAPDGTEVNRSIIFGCGVNQTGHWGMQGWQYGSWAAGGVLGLGWGSPFLYQLTGLGNPSAFAVCLEETGSSHLTIGATGLPAGASYATMATERWVGMLYSHITLTNATSALNITDDPAYVDGDSSFLPEGFPENITPGFSFMPESFVHLLRYPLFTSLIDGMQAMTGQDILFGDLFQLPCFSATSVHNAPPPLKQSAVHAATASKSSDLLVSLSPSLAPHYPSCSIENEAEDPFTTFPTIDIAFISPDNTTSHFYLKPREYLTNVYGPDYCVLATYTPSERKGVNYIGEPGLVGKYLFLNHNDGIGGWMDAPHCGAEPLLPPPSPPPPPSPVSKRATHSLSPLPAALSAALALATSATLLALTFLYRMLFSSSTDLSYSVAMARKRKSAATATDQCPRDLNEIPYIAWMNKQLAAGRKPGGPLSEGNARGGDTSYQAPRDVPTRGRRAADHVASSRVVDDAAFGSDDDDSDYNECDDGTEDDADSGEEEDKGMSDSEDDADADDADADDADGDEDDAPEEAQPAAQTSRRGRGTSASGAKTADKGGEPPRGAAKTRNLHPVKRSVWSPRESTILVAARWFMKDELEPLIGKQGSQYWARLVRHIKKENTGWVRGVNAVQEQWRNLVTMFKQLKKGEKASGKGAVCKPPWFPYMELFQNNRAVAHPHVVDGGGATHVNVPCGCTAYAAFLV